MTKKGGKKTPAKRDERILQLEEKLIENLVEMQKVYADVAIKFDSLTKEISSLLGLFESAAKTFADQAPKPVEAKDKEFTDKIEKLLEQNKLIAKGITLLEERMNEKAYTSSPSYLDMAPASAAPQSRPLPRF